MPLDRGEVAVPEICVVTHPLSGAGENATRTLLEILAALTAVSLVTVDLPADSSIRDEHDVIELSRRGVGGNPAVAALRFGLNQLRMCRVLTRRRESVVLFFGATSYVVPILVAKLLGKTVVLEPRGDVPLTLRLSWEQQVPAPLARGLADAVWLLERIGFWLADGVITYTPGVAAQLGLSLDSEKVFTTGARFVDTDRFAPTTPIEERETVAGFLGRLDEEKGIRELAATAKLLADGVTFRFIGDGALRGWLEREVADQIEAGTVEVSGWVAHRDVPDELNRLRLLVLRSQPTEGLPTTILEAFACGTPVLATPVSGVPDVIEEGKTGFLSGAEGPAALADEIEGILGRDDLERIGHNARALVEAEYSFESAVERYGTILRAVSG